LGARAEEQLTTVRDTLPKFEAATGGPSASGLERDLAGFARETTAKVVRRKE